MRFVHRLITLPRRAKSAVVFLAIAALWSAWAFWPPRPDFRVVGPGSFASVILTNGRQVVFHENIHGYGITRTYRARVIDTSTGKITEARYQADRARLSIAPDGRHAVVLTGDDRFELLDWPSGERVATVPLGRWSESWSPDGRYLALSEGSKLLLVQAATGAIVSELVQGAIDPVFLADSSGICVLSPDHSRVDVLGLDPIQVWESLALPYPPADPDAKFADAPRVDSCRIQSLWISDDSNTLAAVIVRYPRDAYGVRVVDSIVTWDRASGQRVAFDLGDQGTPAGIHLDLSFDGRRIGTTHWYQLGTFDFPDWRSDSDTAKKSEVSAWQVIDGRANQVKTPGRLDSVVPCGARFVCVTFGHYSIIDGRTQRLIIERLGRVLNRYRSTNSETGYIVVDHHEKSKFGPRWLRDLIQWLFPDRESACQIVRVSDGAVTRTISGRKPALFDTAGNLWTTTNSPAGGELIERWSPEAPRPWWLYMVTAAGAGYLIWPMLTQLTSRWRQSRPGAVAG